MADRFEEMINFIPNHLGRASTVRKAEAQGSKEHRHQKAEAGKGATPAPGPELREKRGLRALGGQEGGDQHLQQRSQVWPKVPKHAFQGKGKSRSAAQNRGLLTEASLLSFALKTLL